MEPILGQLKKMMPRTQWPREDRDFTTWLAENENIQALGNILGLDLEVEKVEAKVGPFSADILAKDTFGEYVIIENQLEKCDHSHIGKALTYASVLNAKTVIWLATCFTEQHLRTIDWLNNITDDDIRFIAVEIELWQIDDSRPAIKFNIASRSTEFKPEKIKRLSEGELSISEQKQLNFWVSFTSRLTEEKIVPKVREPKPSPIFHISIGWSDIFLINRASVRKNEISLGLYLKNSIADLILPKLIDRKDEIEQAIGAKLEWPISSYGGDKVIYIRRTFDFNNIECFDEGVQWLIHHVSKYVSILIPIVKQLLTKADIEANDE